MMINQGAVLGNVTMKKHLCRIPGVRYLLNMLKIPHLAKRVIRGKFYSWDIICILYSPRMRFLSPTMSSKSKQSNSKTRGSKNNKLYTVEDLETNRYEVKKENKVIKKLNMDKEQHMIKGYRAYEYEQDEHEQQNMNIEPQEDVRIKLSF